MFKIVVAEALDRVSRDQADVAILYKHLHFAGVVIVTLAEGAINELHVGLKGTMNALFLKDLAAKTHRGLRGRVVAIRGLIEHIVLTLGEKRGDMHAALHGDPGTILEWAGSGRGKGATGTPRSGMPAWIW